MATVEYDFFSVVSPLNPGAVIGVTWSHPKFDYGDALTVTAHPIRAVLAVRNLRIFKEGDAMRAAFEVANVGARPEIAFGLGFGWVDR